MRAEETGNSNIADQASPVSHPIVTPNPRVLTWRQDTSREAIQENEQKQRCVPPFCSSP